MYYNKYGPVGQNTGYSGNRVNDISSGTSSSGSGLDWLNGFGGIIGNIANIGFGIRDRMFQREQYNYQKEMDQLVMDRENTAISRAAEDARRAGLSALSATGGADASGTTVSTSSASMPGQMQDMGRNDIKAQREQLRQYDEMMNIQRDKNEVDKMMVEQEIEASKAQVINATSKTIAEVEKLLSDKTMNEKLGNQQVDVLKKQIDLMASQISNLNANTGVQKAQEANIYKDTDLKEWQIRYLITEDYWKNKLSAVEEKKCLEEIDKIKSEKSYTQIETEISKLRLREEQLRREAYKESSYQAKEQKMRSAESVSKQIMMYVTALKDISSEARGWLGKGNKESDFVERMLAQGL